MPLQHSAVPLRGRDLPERGLANRHEVALTTCARAGRLTRFSPFPLDVHPEPAPWPRRRHGRHVAGDVLSTCIPSPPGDDLEQAGHHSGGSHTDSRSLRSIVDRHDAARRDRLPPSRRRGWSARRPRVRLVWPGSPSRARDRDSPRGCACQARSHLPAPVPIPTHWRTWYAGA